jgi:hypothetical protein
MAEMIKVLIIEPKEPPRLETIEHTLENLQKLVGGTIQACYPWNDPVALICDDDGKFKGYEANRVLVDDDGEPYDVVVGTFLITGLTREDFGSLSEEMAEKYTERFRWPEMFMRTMDGHVVWVKLKPGEKPRVIV